MKKIESILFQFEIGSYGVTQAIDKLFDLQIEKSVILEQCKLYLKQQIDLSFDAMLKPSMNIEPPIETGLPSGVSIDSIENQKYKAEYRKLVEGNKKLAAGYLKQTQLRSLDKHIRTFFQ